MPTPLNSLPTDDQQTIGAIATANGAVAALAAILITAGPTYQLAAPTLTGRQIVKIQQTAGAAITLELPTTGLIADKTEFLIIDRKGDAAANTITISGMGNEILTATGPQTAVAILANGGRLHLIWHGDTWSVF